MLINNNILNVSELVQSLLIIFDTVAFFFVFAEKDKKYISPPLLQKEKKYNIHHDDLYLRINFFIENVKINFILAQIQGEKVWGGGGAGREGRSRVMDLSQQNLILRSALFGPCPPHYFELSDAPEYTHDKHN